MKTFNLRLFLVLFIIFFVSVQNSLVAQDSNRERFEKRRQKLMEQMEGGIAVFRSAGNMSDFYYLTGLHEQNAAILITPEGKEKYIIFIRPSSPVRELWSGKHPVQE